MAGSQGTVGHVNTSWQQATVQLAWLRGCRVMSAEWMGESAVMWWPVFDPALLRTAFLFSVIAWPTLPEAMQGC